MPDGSSPMIVPMMLPAAATRSAEKRYGTDVGQPELPQDLPRDGRV